MMGSKVTTAVDAYAFGEPPQPPARRLLAPARCAWRVPHRRRLHCPAP
jgi:hypothetical protein